MRRRKDFWNRGLFWLSLLRVIRVWELRLRQLPVDTDASFACSKRCLKKKLTAWKVSVPKSVEDLPNYQCITEMVSSATPSDSKKKSVKMVAVLKSSINTWTHTILSLTTWKQVKKSTTNAMVKSTTFSLEWALAAPSPVSQENSKNSTQIFNVLVLIHQVQFFQARKTTVNQQKVAKLLKEQATISCLAATINNQLTSLCPDQIRSRSFGRAVSSKKKVWWLVAALAKRSTARSSTSKKTILGRAKPLLLSALITFVTIWRSTWIQTGVVSADTWLIRSVRTNTLLTWYRILIGAKTSNSVMCNWTKLSLSTSIWLAPKLSNLWRRRTSTNSLSRTPKVKSLVLWRRKVC